MTTITVSIKNLDKVEKKLGEVKAAALDKSIWESLGLEVMSEAAPYPAATIANSPSNPSGRWYERGLGTVSRTGHIRPTSEDLMMQWYLNTFQDAVAIGNSASYAPYVHGSFGQQAGFHAVRGWKQLYETALEALPDAVAAIQKQIDRIWRN